MLLPNFIYGRQEEVKARCRALAKAVTSRQDYLDEVLSWGMKDTTADESELLVLEGPSPALTEENCYHLYLPLWALRFHQPRGAAILPLIAELMDEFLKTAWGTLSLTVRLFNRWMDDARRRAYFRAMLTHWEEIDSAGPRYSDGSAHGRPLLEINMVAHILTGILREMTNEEAVRTDWPAPFHQLKNKGDVRADTRIPKARESDRALLLPSFIYGRYKQVNARCKKLGKTVTSREDYLEKILSLGMRDTSADAGELLVLDGPNPSLAQENCYQLYVPLWAIMMNQPTGIASSPLGAELLDESLKTAWGTLLLTHRHFSSWLDDDAKRRAYLRAVFAHWEEISSVGPGYSDGSLTGRPLLEIHTTIQMSIGRLLRMTNEEGARTDWPTFFHELRSKGDL